MRQLPGLCFRCHRYRLGYEVGNFNHASPTFLCTECLRESVAQGTTASYLT